MPIQDELPKSRITLIYRTTISGQPEEVDLPFRLMVLGDFSLGSSEDRKVDLDERKPRSVNNRNLDELMKDMRMSIDFEVPNRINPDVETDLKVHLAINGMKSFHPDDIVLQVPKMRSLMLLKTLLLETQSNVDNRKELRKTMYDLFSNPDALKAVLAELKDYESLRLPAPAAAPGPAPAAAPAAAAAGGAPAPAPAPEPAKPAKGK